MTEYMAGVFVLSGFFSLLGHISYKSQLDGVRKFALGLLLFFVTASPLIKLLGGLSDLEISDIIPDTGSITDGDTAIYEEAFSDGIASLISEKFEIKRSDIRVLTEGFDISGWRCEKIRVILSGSGLFADYHRIEDYINGLEIGECEAEIEIG